MWPLEKTPDEERTGNACFLSLPFPHMNAGVAGMLTKGALGTKKLDQKGRVFCQEETDTWEWVEPTQVKQQAGSKK